MFEWVTPEIWRRMVRAALEKPLGESGVLEAIEFWNKNFSNAVDLQKHMRPYAQAFSEFIGRPEAKTEFALLLISALHTNVALLPEDPLKSKPGSRDAQLTSAPEQPTKPAAEQADVGPSTPDLPNAVDASLNALITLLREQLALTPETKTYLPTFANRIQAKPTLKVMGMQSAQLPAWINWLRKPETTPLAAQLSVDQASKLVGLIYVFLAEVLGPVEADILLSRAVHTIEGTPAGRTQSPRAFL